MNTLARHSLLQAAVLGAIWIVASSFAGQSAGGKIQARHPDMVVSQAFDIVEQASSARHQAGAKKGDLQLGQTNCGGQAWPYISSECLAGTPRKVSRTITIEKRTGPAASSLVRIDAEQQMASR